VIAVATSGMDSDVEMQVTEAWEMWLKMFREGKEHFKRVVVNFGLLGSDPKKATGKARRDDDTAVRD